MLGSHWRLPAVPPRQGTHGILCLKSLVVSHGAVGPGHSITLGCNVSSNLSSSLQQPLLSLSPPSLLNPVSQHLFRLLLTSAGWAWAWAWSRWRLTRALLLLMVGLGMFRALAIPPPPDSFDGETIRCQVAGSAATVLICRDAELRALDRQLRQAFRAALADPGLQDSERAALLREQEQWVIAMDQCWRAGERLRACVKASQSQRLRQLQARPATRQPAPAQP